MFSTNLAGLKNVDVVDPQKVSGAISRFEFIGGAPRVEDSLKAAADLGAAYAVTGDFVIFGGRFRVDVRVYDVKSGTIKFIDKAQSKEDAMFDMVDQLSDKMVLAIGGALPPAAGGLQVTTDPHGAALFVDDENAGTTPATVKNLKAGAHTIRLALAGYQDYAQSVDVKENGVAKVDVKLIRLYGGIRVWWRQLPNSDISIGGETISMAQFQSVYMLSKFCRNVPAGDYKVSVRMPFKDESSWDTTPTWRTYSAEVTINPGEVTDVYINNGMSAPSIDIATCAPCAASWDFTTKVYWYE